MAFPLRAFTFAAMALGVFATSCAERDSAPVPNTDSADSPRIVSLAPAITEVLFALGAGDWVVGVTDYCDFPEEARRLPKVGGYVNPSVEAVLALRPDLVLISPAAGNREPALILQRAGMRVEVVPMESLSETLIAIETIAHACGLSTRGAELVADIRRRIAAASTRVAAVRPVPTLFCVQVNPIIGAGAGTLPSELLELAGGKNVVTATRYPQIGLEAILTAAPEVILQARMDAADDAAAEAAEAFWKRWPAIPAVRAGRVVVFDATIALRPGPRVAEAVETIANILHDPETTSSTNPHRTSSE